MQVSLNTLERAVARFREGLALHRQDPNSEIIRDGLIQRFEFTYELSHKVLRRFLAQRSANVDEVMRVDYPTLIRMADEHDLLLHGWPMWKAWRELRAKTSHTYDGEIAGEVLDRIPDFLVEIEHLLSSLRQADNEV